MKRGTKLLSIAFFLTGAICIALDNSTTIIPGFLAKALLIPILIFILAINIHQKLSNFDKVIFAGLLFSWAGDVILSMLTSAINRLEKVNTSSYYFVLIGAVLFVISDSAIAINKFSLHFESSGIVVMTTYIIAQYLIVSGFIKQSKR